jgi:hypothetical protein
VVRAAKAEDETGHDDRDEDYARLGGEHAEQYKRRTDGHAYPAGHRRLRGPRHQRCAEADRRARDAERQLDPEPASTAEAADLVELVNDAVSDRERMHGRRRIIRIGRRSVVAVRFDL